MLPGSTVTGVAEWIVRRYEAEEGIDRQRPAGGVRRDASIVSVKAHRGCWSSDPGPCIAPARLEH